MAPRLAAAGHRVYALDWRGHGDSQWVGAGGYYHFADYVADLAGIVPQLGDRVALVSHSMGGNAALLYTGLAPERVTALVTIEGLGPPDSDPESAPERFAGWLADLERSAQRSRPGLSRAEVVARLRQTYARLSAAAIAHLAEHGTRASDGERREWKFDPLHQTRSPQPFYLAQAQAFWRRVRCPVLYVDGDESALRYPEEELRQRLAVLRARRVTIAGSGHHPHIEQPEALAQAVVEFLA